MISTLVVEAKLSLRTALHIGAGASLDITDAPVRRNAAGDIVIPGSALAGPLRALATRLAPRLGHGVCTALQSGPDATRTCGCAVCHLFGEVQPQEFDTEEEGGRASRLWIYDARLCQQATPYIRDNVGIDRTNQVAARAAAAKFDVEVLPAGTTFDIRLELEDASEDDQRLLAVILAEWQDGHGTLGGRVARGLGALKLSALRVYARRLDRAEKLMIFLRSDDFHAGLEEKQNWLALQLNEARQRIAPAPAGNARWVAGSWAELRCTLQATGPFLVNDQTRARWGGFDHAPLNEGHELLPGSSLRGVLRSQAERIARTLATQCVADSASFLRACPACSPLARSADPQQAVALQSCDSLLDEIVPNDQEVPEEQLCLACRLFGSTHRGSRLLVEDAPLLGFTQASAPYKVQDFLAIDRFTGGGLEGAKFDALELWQASFDVRLRLENPRPWELGWLILALRDLADEWLPVGFGGAKGFGKVHIVSPSVTFGLLQEADFPGDLRLLGGLPAFGNSIYRELLLDARVQYDSDPFRPARFTPTTHAEAWLAHARAWVTACAWAVRTFAREEGQGKLPLLRADSYWGQTSGNWPLKTLYPRYEEVKPHA